MNTQTPREFLAETFSRAAVDEAIQIRQRDGWELTRRRDNDDGKSTTVTFQRSLVSRPAPPEPMNKKARERCLAALDASEEAWSAFQSLRQLVESDDIENVRHIKRAVGEIDSWLYNFKRATIGLCEEDA